MTVESNVVRIQTREEGEMLDNIMEKVQAVVGKRTIKNGVAFLFVPGSTAALTTIEDEPGLLADLPSMLERIAPEKARTNMTSDGMMETVILISERH
ncbi:MAG TPA: YjbQ family protein [Candidatus Angelobacter sp.]|nr:YjbQ family protein [Candidatus Angelobacter sp.]